MLSIELPEDVSNRLELLSLSTGRTMQFYIKEALLEYLEEVEITCDEKERGNEEHYRIFDELNHEYGNENGLS